MTTLCENLREPWPPRLRDGRGGGAAGQEEALAAGALVDAPLLEPFEALLEPFDEVDEPLDDDSDFAALLVVLLPLSEPDERESVR